MIEESKVKRVEEVDVKSMEHGFESDFVVLVNNPVVQIHQLDLENTHEPGAA